MLLGGIGGSAAISAKSWFNGLEAPAAGNVECWLRTDLPSSLSAADAHSLFNQDLMQIAGHITCSSHLFLHGGPSHCLQQTSSVSKENCVGGNGYQFKQCRAAIKVNFTLQQLLHESREGAMMPVALQLYSRGDFDGNQHP